MCYNISLLNPSELGIRYDIQLSSEDSLFNLHPIYHRNAFDLMKYPIITNQDSKEINYSTWGLVPNWIKNINNAKKIQNKTMNARCETLFEKPSFKSAIEKRRCIIPVDGFFEWRYYDGKNYPYYIYLTGHKIFSIAGIWDVWKNPDTEIENCSFSLITCPANNMMEKIHNKKKRMPVILSRDIENNWIKRFLSKNEIERMLKPYNLDDLQAHTISRLITQRNKQKNNSDVIKQFDYVPLKNFQ